MSSSDSSSTSSSTPTSAQVTRVYEPLRQLKYGVNPHQSPSSIYTIVNDQTSTEQPFTVLNGTPGYINLLDALNAWQLVDELKKSLHLPAATSFKHVSPAGAAVYSPLSDIECQVYDIPLEERSKLTQASIAYLRARQADPKCSFGDFAAISEIVDEQTALIIKKEVSDGIIAPGYDEKALEILKSKKNGAYIILQANTKYVPPPIEYREVYGVVFAQKRNDVILTKEHLKVVSANKDVSEHAIRDLLLASITCKYTQSNSVVYAINGQVVGVGAGQQSRVDCVKLAGTKVETWWLRQHEKVLNLPFKSDVRRVDRVNGRISYIEGGHTPQERAAFLSLFTSEPVELTAAEKAAHLAKLTGVALSSDAFFPFRDNIDQAAKRGVSYIAQPGGSVADEEVTKAVNEYDMKMVFTGVRLFHH